MAATPSPRLVSRPKAPGGLGTPQPLRLVAMPAVRDRAGRDDIQRASSPSRELRYLCCEGVCSTGLGTHLAKEPELRAIGYSTYNLRGAESASMTHTAHYFVRISRLVDTNFHLWACTQCGNERVYGAEEV